MKGYTRGVETSVTWTPLRKWRLQGAYSREDADLSAVTGSVLVVPPEALWRTPRNTLNLHSAWDVTRRWSIDSTFAWVSRIPDSNVPSYTRVDLHIARKFGEGSEISGGVRNLFDEKHLEFTSEDYVVSSLARRDVYVRIMWRF